MYTKLLACISDELKEPQSTFPQNTCGRLWVSVIQNEMLFCQHSEEQLYQLSLDMCQPHCSCINIRTKCFQFRIGSEALPEWRDVMWAETLLLNPGLCFCSYTWHTRLKFNPWLKCFMFTPVSIIHVHTVCVSQHTWSLNLKGNFKENDAVGC